MSVSLNPANYDFNSLKHGLKGSQEAALRLMAFFSRWSDTISKCSGNLIVDALIEIYDTHRVYLHIKLLHSGSDGKESPVMQETRVQPLGWEDLLEKGWQPTPVFLPENPMDRAAWQAIIHRASKSQTQLKRLRMHAHSILIKLCLI